MDNLRRRNVGSLTGIGKGIAVALAASMIVLSGSISAGATEEVTVELRGPSSSDGSTTIVHVPFSAARTLSDALRTTDIDGYKVLGYRFENAEVVGEFSPLTGIQPEQYLEEFFQTYGTEPQFVAAIVSVPVHVAEAWAGEKNVSGYRDSAEEFVAAPVDAAKLDDLLAGFRDRNPALNGSDPASLPEARSASALAATTWQPTQADIMIFRANSSIVYFQQYYYWDGTTAHTTVMHPDDGWEGEVNIFTARPASQVCGTPGTDPGDYPFAKNYGWTWAALVNTGGGMGTLASAAGAYADYNDDSDPCGKNSMAIGIRTPQAIPSYPSGMQEVMLTIQAPRGLDNTGRIGGVVQAVNETGCFLQPWLSSTDCMGVTSSSAGARPTLGEWRNWTAPPKCWVSMNYGNATPTTYLC